MSKYEFSGLWNRFCARALDGLYLIPLMTFFYIISFLLKDSGSFIVNSLFAIESILYGLYFILLLSGIRQATYGMRKRNIIILDKEGHRISFVRSMIRYLFIQMPLLALLIIMKLPLVSHNFNFVLSIVFVLTTCLIILMYLHPKKKFYYDIIAGTYVIYGDKSDEQI